MPESELHSSVLGRFTFGLVPDGSVFEHCPKLEHFNSDFQHFLTS